MGNWGLIVFGLIVGTIIGVPSARQVKMTQIPQMVALFNGVGGGAVALIAWAEFNETGGFADLKLTFVIPSLFAAIVGSVCFWGSNIAFGKLQEILPGQSDQRGQGAAADQPAAARRRGRRGRSRSRPARHRASGSRSC